MSIIHPDIGWFFKLWSSYYILSGWRKKTGYHTVLHGILFWDRLCRLMIFLRCRCWKNRNVGANMTLAAQGRWMRNVDRWLVFFTSLKIIGAPSKSYRSGYNLFTGLFMVDISNSRLNILNLLKLAKKHNSCLLYYILDYWINKCKEYDKSFIRKFQTWAINILVLKFDVFF